MKKIKVGFSIPRGEKKVEIVLFSNLICERECDEFCEPGASGECSQIVIVFEHVLRNNLRELGTTESKTKRFDRGTSNVKLNKRYSLNNISWDEYETSSSDDRNSLIPTLIM